MKKILRLYLTLLVLLLAAFSPALMCAQPDDAIDRAILETVVFLRDLVRIDTTNPPGNESAAAAYIQKIFDREQIQSRLIACAEGRANVVAKLKGTGRTRPILLMAHMDVVGVERGKWSFDPFGAEQRAGYLLGRGAADDKAMLAANVELMLLLNRSGIRLDRDLIFVGTAGEEGTPEFGINCLLEKSPAEVGAEFALNEGGDAPLQVSNSVPLYVAISTAEKTPSPIKIIAKGTPGHGAFPSGNNAITHLAMAVSRISQWQTPVRLNSTTREFFAQISSLNLGEDSDFARTITSPETQNRVQSAIPRYWAMSRTTISPTMINAGFRTNVVPAEATATLDIRLLPDENPDAFFDKLRRVVDDPTISVEPAGIAHAVSPISGTKTEMFHALVAGYRKVYPGITVLPQMVPGSTDCAQLRIHGTQCYGVAIPMTVADRAREHGVDERISIDSVGQYLHAIYNALSAFAVAQGTPESSTPGDSNHE
jgi:acetylornithine deacetylase/succinyl-diaminopimelate desuccinylase-like protein